MNSFLKKIFGKFEKYINRETISYLIFGVTTTIVNYVVYYGLRFFDVNYLAANTVAWIAAVTVAYVTNKLWVFNSKSWAPSVVVREIALFAAARLISLGAETAFMAFTVEVLHLDDRIMKLVAEVFVVILNYVFSKLVIFKKKES